MNTIDKLNYLRRHYEDLGYEVSLIAKNHYSVTKNQKVYSYGTFDQCLMDFVYLLETIK